MDKEINIAEGLVGMFKPNKLTKSVFFYLIIFCFFSLFLAFAGDIKFFKIIVKDIIFFPLGVLYGSGVNVVSNSYLPIPNVLGLFLTIIIDLISCYFISLIISKSIVKFKNKDIHNS